MIDDQWFEGLEANLPDDIFFADRVFRSRPLASDIDFGKTRPFRKMSTTNLRNFVVSALERPWIALELATLGHEEAKTRAEKGGSTETLEIIKGKFLEVQKTPISWLADARQVLKARTALKKFEGGLGSVYFVLIDGFTEQNQFYGCYVGQTRTTNLGEFSDNQSARVSNHFQGNRASLKVKNRGLEPLWSLNHFTLNLTDDTDKILSYETEFNQCLCDVIPRVLGDTL